MPESSITALSPHRTRALASAAPQILVWTGLCAGAAGVLVHATWRELPAGRFGESLLLAGLSAALAWALTRWRAFGWPEALAGVWLVAMVAMSGPVPTLAVALFAVTALALGSLAVGDERPASAVLVGLAGLAALGGWVVALPVHVPAVYLAICVPVIVLRRASLRVAAASLARGWRDAVEAAPRAAGAVVMLAGLASAGTWLPTMQYDDLVYHLGLPWQWMEYGRYAPDPTHQVWALAPWAGDVLHGMAQVVARAEARGPLDLAWFLLAAAGLWRVTGLLGAPPRMRWAAVALYATLPLTTSLLGGMQTEGPAAAAMLRIASLALDEAAPPRRRAFAAACLFGLLCGLKLLHAATAAPLLAWAFWRMRAGLRPADVALAAVAIALVGGSSYAYAWVVAGNPVLPLMNDVFASPYFPARAFDDPRWHAGLGVDILWRITFDTSGYLEGWDGAAGLLFVTLAGAWLAALARPRTRALALCATFAIALPLLPLQYARYLHPGLALLVPCLAVALHRALPARAVVVAVATLCVAQLAFQSNANWFLHTGAIKRSLLALGRDAPLLERYVPERLLAQRIHDEHDDGVPPVVLLLDPKVPYVAEFGGAGRTTDWYDPPLHAAAARAATEATGAAWADVSRREDVAHVIVRPATLTTAQARALRQLGGEVAADVGEAQWWRLPPAEQR